MGITAKKLFNVLLIIFVITLFAEVMLNLAESYLPANRLTHECKPPDTVLYALQNDPNYEQAFCQEYYHVEFKNSWDRTINNIAVPAMLLSGLLLVPTGSVLTYRRLSVKKK